MTRPVHWWPVPALGDIVWCFWPLGGGKPPGPKPRPCLILEIDESVLQEPKVHVAYGTSQRTNQLHTGEFVVSHAGNPIAYAAAGLSYDTKFDMRQTAWLPYSTQAFDAPPAAPYGRNPKLGTLHVSMFHAAKSAHDAVNP